MSRKIPQDRTGVNGLQLSTARSGRKQGVVAVCCEKTLVVLFVIAMLLTGTGALLAADDAPSVVELISGELRTRSGAEASEDTTEVLLEVDLGLIQGNPDAISVLLPDGRTVIARRSHWSWSSAERYYWFGDLDDAIPGQDAQVPGAISFHYDHGRLIGRLRTADGAAYRLVPEGDLHRLVRAAYPSGTCEVGQSAGSKQAREEPGAITGKLAAAGTSDADCFTPVNDTQIDVMVLYPLSLKSSEQAVRDYAGSKVDQANTLFDNSGVKINYNLVYVGPITGEQPPPPKATGTADSPEATGPALEWLTAQFATAAIDTEVELLRKAHGADMISIVVPPHPNDNCGLAILPELRNGEEVMYNSTTPFGSEAFTALELDCGDADYTFAHELGHNFGLRHETPRLSQSGVQQPILPWAYGYDIPISAAVATVMACAGSTPCSRIPHFSNPDISIPNPEDPLNPVPTGLHSSQSSEPAHNACVANLRASQYHDFAQRPPTSPPSLTITSPADGAQVQAGVAFNLVAAASDPEDGDRRAFVQWESDRGDFLGSGSPLSAILTSGGRHLITAKVTDTSGTTVPYSIRLEATEPYSPRRYIDRPRNKEVISGDFLVQGWATDSSGVTSVTFQVDGNPVTLSDFIYGTPRAGVCAVHSDLNDPNCPNVGFQGKLNSEQFTNGRHVLRLTATDYFGNFTTMNREFWKATTFEPVADAWVSEAQPTLNFGADTSLQVRASGSGLAKHTYLKFQVSGLTGPVYAATLKLYTQSTPLQGCRVYWMKDTSWGESTITWQTAPLAFYLQYPTTTYPASSPIEIDVSSIVSGNGTYTIGLVAPDIPGQAFYSREVLYSFRQPKLSVATYY